MHEEISNYMWDVITKPFFLTFNEGIQRNLDFLEKLLNKGWQNGKFDNVPPFSAKSGFSEVYFFSQNKKDQFNEHVGWMCLEKCHSETGFELAILFWSKKMNISAKIWTRDSKKATFCCLVLYHWAIGTCTDWFQISSLSHKFNDWYEMWKGKGRKNWKSWISWKLLVKFS